MSARRFDFVVAGAGLAGLTLAHELARRFPNRTLLLVDPLADRVGLGDENEQRLDRTIGFWQAGPPPFATLLERSYDQLMVDGPGGPQVLALGQLRYHTLRWSTLRDHLLAELRERPQVTRVHGHVRELVERPERLVALVDGEAIAAEFGFDSRLELASLRRAPGRVLCWQSFCGLRIATPEPCFTPERATFMDLRAATDERLAFVNLVPEDRHTALAYHVEIGPRRAPAAMRAALDDDLRRHFGLSSWRVLGHESGVLPLTDQPFARRVGRVRRIGIAGGRLKPSSGYAFTRILADNQAIVRSLAERGDPFGFARDRALYRWFDGVLLALLEREPELGPALFMAMFTRCDPANVFALLDERATARQLLALMLALPHKLRLALGGVARAIAWLRAPAAVALPASSEPLALPEA